jgi:outer membrane protein OmpA-like peptidoglycan-associated protein
MASGDDDGWQGVVLVLVLGLVALVVAGVIGVGIHSARASAKAPSQDAPPAPLAVPAEPAGVALDSPSLSGAQAASDAASIQVEQGVVKFYFSSSKAELAPGASEALAELVQGAQAGRKLLISGFHDATGGAAKNAELARQRALAVRDALLAAGVADKQIELKKPEQVTAGGSDAQARRVEITLQ